MAVEVSKENLCVERKRMWPFSKIGFLAPKPLPPPPFVLFVGVERSWFISFILFFSFFLFQQPGDPKPNVSAPSGSISTSSPSGTVSGAGAGAPGSSSGFGFGLYALMLVGGALAYGVWKYLAATRGDEAGGGVKL